MNIQTIIDQLDASIEGRLESLAAAKGMLDVSHNQLSRSVCELTVSALQVNIDDLRDVRSNLQALQLEGNQ